MSDSGDVSTLESGTSPPPEAESITLSCSGVTNSLVSLPLTIASLGLQKGSPEKASVGSPEAKRKGGRKSKQQTSAVAVATRKLDKEGEEVCLVVFYQNCNMLLY